MSADSLVSQNIVPNIQTYTAMRAWMLSNVNANDISRYSPRSEESENLRNIVKGQRPIWSNKSQRTQSEDFNFSKLV